LTAAGTGDPYVDPNPPPEETTKTSDNMDTTSTSELSDEKVQVSCVVYHIAGNIDVEFNLTF